MGKLDYAPALNLVNDYGDVSVFDRVDLIDLCKTKNGHSITWLVG